MKRKIILSIIQMCIAVLINLFFCFPVTFVNDKCLYLCALSLGVAWHFSIGLLNGLFDTLRERI